MQRRRSTSLAIALVLLFCAAGCQGGGDDEPGGPGVNDPEDGAGEGGDEGGGEAGNGGSGNGAQAGSGAGDAGSGAGAGEGGASGGAGMGAGDGGGDAPFVPVPLTDLPAEFARAICDALGDCVGAAALRELTEREDCRERVAAELAATEFYYIDEAITSGNVLYNSDELPACLEGVRDLGCGVLTDSYPDACVRVLAGNVAEGGECQVSVECQGTAFCAGAASGECPSTCRPLLEEGAACAEDNECADELMCLGGECARLSGDGEPCGGPSGRACALGFSCQGSSDTAAGECEANSAIQVGEEDDTCDPRGTLCREGLSCVYGGAGFHCEPYVGAGEACHLGLPGQCPVEQYCDAADVTAEGTCRELPGDGDACVLSGLCAPGVACVAEGSNAVCRSIGDNGADCSGDAVCRSHHCVSGKCEPPAVCD